jgi:cyclohexyl-isocyanide hydratase
MTRHLHIGAIAFPGVDQADLTGPFEVLVRLPDSTFHIIWKETAPVRDVKGFVLTPDTTFAQVPPLDLLVVPGGWGQEALMEDEAVLGFLRSHAAADRPILSVCTGALLLGAAGLLRGARATTHWSAFHLLKYFGALPVRERVVVHGKLISAAGVTSGIDGALRMAALLRGETIAQQIQLGIEYAPEPPFECGTPELAPADILASVQEAYREITAARLATAQRYAERFA